MNEFTNGLDTPFSNSGNDNHFIDHGIDIPSAGPDVLDELEFPADFPTLADTDGLAEEAYRFANPIPQAGLDSDRGLLNPNDILGLGIARAVTGHDPYEKVTHVDLTPDQIAAHGLPENINDTRREAVELYNQWAEKQVEAGASPEDALRPVDWDAFKASMSERDVTVDKVGISDGVDNPDTSEARQSEKIEVVDDNGDSLGFITREFDGEGRQSDLIVTNTDGEEIRVSDFAEIMTCDERMEDIASNALLVYASGGDAIGFLADEIEKYTGELTRDPVEHVAVDPPAEATYQDRFDEHMDLYRDHASMGQWYSRDLFASYHQMAATYNAFKGDIELNGRVPTRVDVFLSATMFLRANALEFAIIELFSAIESKLDSKETPDVETVRNIDFGPVDKTGVSDSGFTTGPVDKVEVSSVREEIPMAGRFYGTDMTAAPDSRSNDTVTIRTTNPDNVGGRGVEITSPTTAESRYLPDIRMVELGGDKMLVDPFGKVIDIHEKFSVGNHVVGDHLRGVDVSASPKVRDFLADVAQNERISVPELKARLSDDAIRRFCDRVEGSYTVESESLRKEVIPREQAARDELAAKDRVLEKYEAIAEARGDVDTLANIKGEREKLGAAIERMDDRIGTFAKRADTLDYTAKLSRPDTLAERFERAVSVEKDACGRSLTSVDVGLDTKSVDAYVDKGIEVVKDAVDRYNDTKDPSERLTLNEHTGELVSSRFGISADTGRYVGGGTDSPASPSEKDVTAYLDVNRPFVGGIADVANVAAETTLSDVASPTSMDSKADVSNDEAHSVDRFENDQIVETTHFDGDGKIVSVDTFQDGILVDREHRDPTTGEVTAVDKFVDGKLSETTHYDVETGEVASVDKYENERLVETTVYDVESGEIISVDHFDENGDKVEMPMDNEPNENDPTDTSVDNSDKNDDTLAVANDDNSDDTEAVDAEQNNDDASPPVEDTSNDEDDESTEQGRNKADDIGAFEDDDVDEESTASESDAPDDSANEHSADNTDPDPSLQTVVNDAMDIEKVDVSDEQSDALTDLFDKLCEADSFGEALSTLVDAFIETVESRIETDGAKIEDLIERATSLVQDIADLLGEKFADFVEKVFEHPDISDDVNELFSTALDGVDQEMTPRDVAVNDSFIDADGAVDLSGADAGGFANDIDAEDAVQDVENDIPDIVDNGFNAADVDMQQSDIDQGIDSNAESGVVVEEPEYADDIDVSEQVDTDQQDMDIADPGVLGTYDPADDYESVDVDFGGE